MEFFKWLGFFKELGIFFELGIVLFLEMNVVGGMRVFERKFFLSMKGGFIYEGKDDLGERRGFMGIKFFMELGFRVGLRKEDFVWNESFLGSNKYEERMVFREIKFLLSKGFEMRFKR